QLELLCPDWELYGLASALMALKGVAWLTATSLAAELGDMRRFPSAPAMMAYLGLSPGEHPSGQRVRRGGDHQGRQQPRAILPRGVGAALPPPAQGEQ